jgi:nitronate monooxygenase
MNRDGQQKFLGQTGATVPVICGPMFPCSNPELVAAVSAAGGIGVVQPISLTYVHGHEYREGLRLINRLANGRPIGFNALVEKSSRVYEQRMIRWVEIALEEGVRFFITSLGNPRWVVDKVHAAGGVVYHDVINRRWGEKGRDEGVDGLIAVNDRAGGHLGNLDPRALLDALAPLGLPVVAAGGVGSAPEFAQVLGLGYAAVQCGTRFIATTECKTGESYKQAIVAAKERDIVNTQRLSGVPVAVINTPYIQRLGTDINGFWRWMFRGRRTKHWARTYFGLMGLWRLKRDQQRPGTGRGEYWQAGRSVETIDAVLPAGEIVQDFAAAWRAAP